MFLDRYSGIKIWLLQKEILVSSKCHLSSKTDWYEAMKIQKMSVIKSRFKEII
jgi:hypothetical protein